MSRKSVVYKKEYEHQDLADLLRELKENHSGNLMEDRVTPATMDKQIRTFPAPTESEERHRIMSNQKIKYLYSRHSNMIHDKHCRCVRQISDDNLGWSEEYKSELKPCPECMIPAYIVAGAKDPEEIDLYRQFFEKAEMTDGMIRDVFIENGMKTRIAKDVMTIWHKEDTWRIKILSKKGHVQLYHNNYVVRKNGIREFAKGFHIQSTACGDTRIGYALRLIKNYEYKPEEYALHNRKSSVIENKKIEQKKIEKVEETALMEELVGDRTKTLTLWKKIKEFFSKFKKEKTPC